MPTLADALRKQKSRSTRSRAQDARKTSKRVVQPTNKKGVASWIKNSGRRTDIRGLDTAGSGRAPARAKTATKTQTKTKPRVARKSERKVRYLPVTGRVQLRNYLKWLREKHPDYTHKAGTKSQIGEHYVITSTPK